jgi:predicted transcriptional regulator
LLTQISLDMYCHRAYDVVVMPKKSTTLRLSETVKQLLKRLADQFGVSQAAIVEIAVRKLAESESHKWSN